MTSALTPAFASPSASALPLYVLRPEEVAAFLAGAGARWTGWLAVGGFDGALGEVRLLPGPDGAIDGAVAGFGTDAARRRQRFGLAKAVAGLPKGDWRLEGRLSTAERTEAALAWLLAGYRFDRYRPGRKPVDPPHGLSAPRGLMPPG
jgi:leucyl aminopeptidase